ncbi:glutaredoxin-C9-like [Olea europaea var. sylvestris]|uniref:Glutaredoxin-C9-like n=1 Tax=Olea europaea subsp. europaea TaxID=158383 RepID=A0A8S0VCQ0_OLEEU|nr:glutaredoxin-C9-like [Olea europaea var. sylvestris]CAA3028835.1 glutaredoxin-C9-like [Olea europaea subsp. europaea]
MCKTRQEPIPYRNLLLQENPQTIMNPNPDNVKRIKENASSLYDIAVDLKNMVKDNAVIVFGKEGCCMSYVVKRLLQGLGVNPTVYEVDEEDENDVVIELEGIGAGDGKEGRMQFPTVFIGGRWFGGLERIMATHITGELTTLLKQAGALWL